MVGHTDRFLSTLTIHYLVKGTSTSRALTNLQMDHMPLRYRSHMRWIRLTMSCSRSE